MLTECFYFKIGKESTKSSGSILDKEHNSDVIYRPKPVVYMVAVVALNPTCYDRV